MDYLLKPFSAERFQEAMDRARERLAARAAAAPDDAAMVRDAKPRTGPAGRVLIRDGANVHVLPVDTIDYVEAQDDYVAFKSEGKQYLKDQTLAAVEATMDPVTLRPDPSLVSAQHRPHRESRAVREGQPDRHPERRHASTGQPRRLRAAVGAVVDDY